MKSFLCLIMIVIFISSCSYNVEENLYNTNCTPTDVSFTNDVLPIIKTNCYSCHSGQYYQGNINLEGYANVLISVEDGSLLGSVKHESGFSAMPQSQAKLANCSIIFIETWIAEGAKNN